MSMGMTAARHARSVVANAEIVVALEALGAAQAIDLRSPLAPGPRDRRPRTTRCAASCPSSSTIASSAPDIDAALGLVRSGALIDAVTSAVGALA